MFISSPLFVVFHNTDLLSNGFYTLAGCSTVIYVETTLRALLYRPVLILREDIPKFKSYKYNLDYNQVEKKACLLSYCLHVELLAYVGIVIALFLLFFAKKFFHK